MSIFDLRQSVIDEYSKYVQSFLSIADDRIRAFIENRSKKTGGRMLWVFCLPFEIYLKFLRIMRNRIKREISLLQYLSW